MNLEDYIKDLAPDLQEKARACGSTEELLALAREAKVPLPDEALAAIAGGDEADPDGCGDTKCPKCNSRDTVIYDHTGTFMYWRCNNCGYKWEEQIPF